MVCFDKNFYVFLINFFLTLISVHIGLIWGLFRTESEKEKKKKISHGRACSLVHSRSARPCISDSGALTQSVHLCFPGAYACSCCWCVTHVHLNVEVYVFYGLCTMIVSWELMCVLYFLRKKGVPLIDDVCVNGELVDCAQDEKQ